MSNTKHWGPERRMEPRLSGLYPLRIRVKTTNALALTAHTLADNLCSGGVYFQWPYPLAIGQRLFMFIQLANGVKIAARGEILRQETRAHNLTGAAIRFVKSRVIAWRG